MIYKQCYLENGSKFQMSWIPQSYAKEGNYLKIKKLNGEFENGWLVKKVYNNEKDSKNINILSRQYLKQRDVSDI